MMLEYIEILKSFPEELREPMLKLIESVENRIYSRLGVTKEDLLPIRDAIRELAEAQRRSEERITRLERVVERLEEAVERLAEAQRRTEERVDKLAEAQRATEERLNELARITRSVELKIGALGARWGVGSETAFRNAIRGILEEAGFRVERYLKFDEEGVVFGKPDQVELDVVVRDEKVFLIEIKSSISRGDVSTFERKVRFYQEKEGRAVDRKIIISPFLDPGAEDMAREFGMEVYTDADQVR